MCLDGTGVEPLDDMVDATPDMKDVLVNNRVFKGTLMGFWRRKELLEEHGVGGGGQKRTNNTEADGGGSKTKKFKPANNSEGHGREAQTPN